MAIKFDFKLWSSVFTAVKIWEKWVLIKPYGIGGRCLNYLLWLQVVVLREIKRNPEGGKWQSDYCSVLLQCFLGKGELLESVLLWKPRKEKLQDGSAVWGMPCVSGVGWSCQFSLWLLQSDFQMKQSSDSLALAVPPSLAHEHLLIWVTFFFSPLLFSVSRSYTAVNCWALGSTREIGSSPGGQTPCAFLVSGAVALERQSLYPLNAPSTEGCLI